MYQQKVEVHDPPRTAFEARRKAQKQIALLKPHPIGYRMFQVINFARSYKQEHGIEPSYRLIRQTLGISTNGEVSEIVSRLIARGLAYREEAGAYEPRLRLM